MRILLGVILVATAAWAGYWFIGSTAAERGLRGWLDARGAEGWVANYSDVSTIGFPNRFDTTITDLELADPATGIAWTAPFFQIFALSYRPNHIIAIWPDTHVFATPLERIEMQNSSIQASVVFEPGTSLVLNRSTFVIEGLTLTSNAGWTAEVPEGRLATRQTPARLNFHDIGFEATDLRPADPLLAQLDPTGLLPDRVETLKLDVTLGFDAPWDRFAIEDARPGITAVEINVVKAQWGIMERWAAGDLTVDAQGVPEGKITVKAKNWRDMLQVGVSAGWVPESLVPTIEGGFGLLASLSGDPKTLDAPLTFENGKVFFGPISLGPAPRLVLR